MCAAPQVDHLPAAWTGEGALHPTGQRADLARGGGTCITCADLGQMLDDGLGP